MDSTVSELPLVLQLLMPSVPWHSAAYRVGESINDPTSRPVEIKQEILTCNSFLALL